MEGSADWLGGEEWDVVRRDLGHLGLQSSQITEAVSDLLKALLVMQQELWSAGSMDGQLIRSSVREFWSKHAAQGEDHTKIVKLLIEAGLKLTMVGESG